MSWTVLGDSVTGTSHRARGLPCQDAFRARPFGPAGEWLVVAVADGAGSSSHADVGAVLACDELARRVEETGPAGPHTRDGVVDLFAGVRTALLAEAEAHGVRPRELACTVLLAVVGPESAVFAQVGDGVIVTGDGLEYRTVFWPDPGEYANATDFLTDDSFAEAVRVELRTGRVADLAVLTDGLQRLALDYSARVPHPGFFRPLFRQLRAEAAPDSLRDSFRRFLDSPRVNDRTDDDKTLVLAARHDAHETAPTD